jgi:hypothetical protein
MDNEQQRAWAAMMAINAFEQLRPSSPKRAALQLFGVAVENCLDHDIQETDLTQLIFRISREREEAHLNGIGK